MRKDETLEQEAARKKLERELSQRIQRGTGRVASLCDQVRQMMERIIRNHRSNDGGENSGKLL